MNERFDDLARQVAERAPRRAALMGLGALALGSLGVTRVRRGGRGQERMQQVQAQVQEEEQEEEQEQEELQQEVRNKCRNK